jgi:hypothetical protein
MPHCSSRLSCLLPLVFALAASACGSGAPLSPSDLALLTTTDTFSGTLAVGATAVHPFVGKTAGTITLTITAIGPDSSTRLGLGLGAWDGASCTVQVSATDAAVSTPYQASISGPGNFCVSLAAPGTLVTDTTYTVQVTHP